MSVLEWALGARLGPAVREVLGFGGSTFGGEGVEAGLGLSVLALTCTEDLYGWAWRCRSSRARRS